MITILIIIAGIVVTGLIAYSVVNFIPRKLHWVISLILIAIAAFLGYKINFEIQKPVQFNKEKKVRFAKVIKNLKIIRDAEVAHKKVTGRYTADGEALIQFIDTAKFALTQTRNVPEEITLSGGITKIIEKRVVDTIGYEDVKIRFLGSDYKNMLNVPNTNDKFKIEIGEIEKIRGLFAPVFEIKIDKKIILKGMDRNLINQEREAIGGEEIRGKYLRVGSLGEVSEEGNWPPFYDQGDNRNKE